MKSLQKKNMTNKPTIDLRRIVHAEAKKEAKRSWSWYENKVRNAAAGMSAQRFLGDNIAHQTKTVSPGDMIMYFYDPKTKNDLPYYDTFPLLLPFGMDEKHFTGLNLHYISPAQRAVLLQKLMEYVTDDKLSPKTKINASWSVLKNASTFPEVAPCVKQYLFGRVKSNYIVIPPKEWEYVIWLPLEKFKKSSNEAVWADSSRRKR